jgi:hypothetical protein
MTDREQDPDGTGREDTLPQLAVLLAGIIAMLCAERYGLAGAGPLPQRAGE